MSHPSNHLCQHLFLHSVAWIIELFVNVSKNCFQRFLYIHFLLLIPGLSSCTPKGLTYRWFFVSWWHHCRASVVEKEVQWQQSQVHSHPYSSKLWCQWRVVVFLTAPCLYIAALNDVQRMCCCVLLGWFYVVHNDGMPLSFLWQVQCRVSLGI